MDARQRRMWVLPAPKGGLDKRDRYAIGIFYSFLFLIAQFIKPLRAIFMPCPDTTIFISKKGANVFKSARKIGQKA